MSLKIICPHCKKPLGREGLERDAVCPHCGKAVTPPETNPESGLDQGKHTRAGKQARRLSVALFLLALGVILMPLGFILSSYIYGALGFTLVLLMMVGGFTLILAGTILASMTLWDPGRVRGPGDGLVLTALILSGIAIVPTFVVAINIARELSYILEFDAEASLESEAFGYCRESSTALLRFHKDTDTWPMFSSSDHGPESRLDYLYGNMGDMPQFKEGEVAESWGTRSQSMFFQLVTNGKQDAIYAPRTDAEAKGWSGPYLPFVVDDPWGYAYLISVSGFEGGTKPGNHVWCLSAGPNGIVDTPAWATETRGDDVGYMTK